MVGGIGLVRKRPTDARRKTSRRANALVFLKVVTASADSPISPSNSSAEIYLRDHADLQKRSAKRDREILKTLNRFFGSAILHELTAHRIEQFKRDRLDGTWRAFKQKASANPVKPGTVNRELDTLKSILSKAVEWKYLI
jgi:hypothetical protein